MDSVDKLTKIKIKIKQTNNDCEDRPKKQKQWFREKTNQMILKRIVNTNHMVLYILELKQKWQQKKNYNNKRLDGFTQSERDNKDDDEIISIYTLNEKKEKSNP